MEDITVSAPGKVILHGEHAVVYGKKAVAASLNLRTFLHLHPTDTGRVDIRLPNIGIHAQWQTEDLVKAFKHPLCDLLHASPPSATLLQELKDFAKINLETSDTSQLAVVAFLYAYCSICYKHGSLPSLDVCLSSNIPTSAGLGSSAAFSTTLAVAFLLHTVYIHPAVSIDGQKYGSWSGKDLELINTWAFQMEKIIHGNPSGIDNSISCYGGAISFQAGNLVPLKHIPTLNILLVNTKVPRSTKVLVAGVKDKYNKFPSVIGPILDSIGAISECCESLLSESDGKNITAETHQSLTEMIDINQHLLAVLGVSHPALDKVCTVTASHGLSCKLTGAGGGGCAFALLPPDGENDLVDKIRSQMHILGYKCSETTVGECGVIQHFSLDDHFVLPENFKDLKV